MDPRIHIWNTLHDGQITAISEERDGALTMFVSIPYLRRRLPPLGDSFVLSLRGVTCAEFRSFDETKTSLSDALESGSPEILATESESMPIRIETTLGHLFLDFQTISFALDTGQPIEFDAIAKACDDYWTDWKAKAEQRAAADVRNARG